MRRILLVGFAVVLVSLGVVLFQHPAAAQVGQGEPYSCSLDGVANSLTVCMAAKGEKRFYIKQIVAQSTTATGGQMLLQYGTGTACGTGTTSLFPSSASAVRIGYPANTIAPTVIPFDPPIAAPKEKDLCVLAIATQTLSITLNGYLGQ